MEVKDLPKKGYAVIRCHDGVIVAKLHSFPECQRALMYRRGGMVSFMPLAEDEIIGTPTLFTQMLEKAGYRVAENSGIIPS
ncbi:hypothetical protein RJ492_000526 [Pluralibacter gergoviae]|uniref:Uncharacterized protein n=1 Tax=Pluralibacter gergoviae TaxID=61647 RepID=A0A089PNZ6_PLUGE|nr:hypothetical protein [Pluralibacter gergoviae]AIR01967.1 hypothetical protein LG71_19620 [Pluralibacter gergoviae]AVR03744.1 hypothetical protein A8H26_14135 [Pluralibacter gergoviae]EKT9641778.1 hypothetical protein [Pluralibacter gergoviae]EKV0913246.1 hypothetical protein [Pluralibacter gergoviae]EKV3545293.1 hypothetical protein [Pluralibacter gergoviae]